MVTTGSGTQNGYLQLDRPTWVWDTYFALLAPEKRLLRPYPAPKNPETPKNAIKPFGAQWILDASGRHVALQHRPTADSGHANDWCTVGSMQTDHVYSYTTPTLALGPRLRWVLAEGVPFM